MTHPRQSLDTFPTAGQAKSQDPVTGAVRLTLSWELFVLLLTALSVVNLVLFVLVASAEVAEVVVVVDIGITAVFVGDLMARLTVARDRRAYLVRGRGWLDVVACIPGLRVVRFVKVVSVTRRIRAVGGFRANAELLFVDRARTILLFVILLTVVVIEFGSMAMLAVEQRAPDGNIKTASDALWYLVVTISTIGYGDRYPTTNLGRLVGTVIVITGVALFSTLTGYLAHFFYGSGDAETALVQRRARQLAAGTDQDSEADTTGAHAGSSTG